MQNLISPSHHRTEVFNLNEICENIAWSIGINRCVLSKSQAYLKTSLRRLECKWREKIPRSYWLSFYIVTFYDKRKSNCCIQDLKFQSLKLPRQKLKRKWKKEKKEQTNNKSEWTLRIDRQQLFLTLDSDYEILLQFFSELSFQNSQVEVLIYSDGFGSVSLFNGISTFVGYLMPKLFS